MNIYASKGAAIPLTARLRNGGAAIPMTARLCNGSSAIPMTARLCNASSAKKISHNDLARSHALADTVCKYI
jgi:hypothetical protein